MVKANKPTTMAPLFLPKVRPIQGATTKAMMADSTTLMDM